MQNYPRFTIPAGHFNGLLPKSGFHPSSVQLLPVFLNPVVCPHDQQAERRVVASTAMRQDMLAVCGQARTASGG